MKIHTEEYILCLECPVKEITIEYIKEVFELKDTNSILYLNLYLKEYDFTENPDLNLASLVVFHGEVEHPNFYEIKSNMPKLNSELRRIREVYYALRLNVNNLDHRK